MVTHNPAEVALSDRVVVVEKGKISADGKPQDLIKSNEFLRSFLTKEDIKTKRRLYNMSINGANPMQEAAELLNGEAGGRILSDAERAEKRRLLEAHKRAYVGVRKNALKSERVKLGKDLPEKKNASLCSQCRPCQLRAGRKCDFLLRGSVWQPKRRDGMA